jgi:glycosyltransferase involved in cell wall biosynthesis
MGAGTAVKVLHVIPSLWHGDGGPAQALVSIERALAARGVQVETATTDDDGPARHNGKSNGEALSENGVTRRYFAKRTDFYKASPGFAQWIERHVREYDVVHLHSLFSFTTTVGARAARRFGVPYVMRPLGTLEAWGLTHRRRWLKQISLRWVEAPLLRDAAAVHFTSEDEAKQSAATGIAMRGVVIPLGVAVPADMQNREPHETLRVLYLSRLAPKKNLEALLEACALLRAENVAWRLTIAGDGDAAYSQALRQRAAALGIDATVEWLGRVHGDAKRRAFESADVFALPSHSENFGIAAAEALAQGLPCVLGRGVAIAQDVQDAGAGIAIDPTPANVAAALKHMIPADTRAAMSTRAARLARERYSITAMGARLEQLYTDIVTGRHGFPAKH